MATAALWAIDDPLVRTHVLLFGDAYAVKAPNVTLTLGLQRAAAGKRVGETVLMTVLALRAEERLAAEPQAVFDAVAGLRAAGLEAEAHALAIEAALDAGL